MSRHEQAGAGGRARGLDAATCGPWVLVRGDAIQKAAYLLHDLLHVPFDSFELRDELSSMRSDRLLKREVQPPPYRPRIRITDRGRELEERLARTTSRHGSNVDWKADRLGERGVLDLERLATALWVMRQVDPQASTEDRAEALNEVKLPLELFTAAAPIRLPRHSPVAEAVASALPRSHAKFTITTSQIRGPVLVLQPAPSDLRSAPTRLHEQL